jgi:transposase
VRERRLGCGCSSYARKLEVVIWHLVSKDESCARSRASLHAKKLRDLELKAG